MCGLVGVFDLQQDAQRFRRSLQASVDSLTHRGPDDSGEFFDGPVGLGFRRLSILDLTTSGHQPMTSSDGRWTVVYNGEIYNFLELSRELAEDGVSFRGGSDTEVLVEAFAKWGPSCLDRFNGMWAVLAWDARQRLLYAARDPWGIKPLYVSDQGTHVGFASEIKALRRLGCDLGTADLQSVRNFILDAALDTDTHTMFSRVRRLEPGNLYTFRLDKDVSQTAYSDGTESAEVPSSDDEEGFIEAFHETFIDAVRIRLRSDVKVGTSLSGGLDSTAITGATAHVVSGERINACRHAFTAAMPEFDESPYIEALIEKTSATWHVTHADESTLENKCETFFRVHDEPIHALSALAGFLVMELAAREGVRVLLNGQGSDELMAGYPSYVTPYLRSLLCDETLRYAFQQACSEAGNTTAGLKLLARSSIGLMPGLWWRQPLRYHSGERMAIAKDVLSQTAGLPAAGRFLHDFLHHGISNRPLPLFLRIEDANSSAFSLEARLPFLDPRIVAFTRKAPARLLRRNGLNKYLLRCILPGLVPDIVWKRRDKMGFPVPHERWLRGPLRTMFTDAVNDRVLRHRGWYQASEVIRMRDKFLSGEGAIPRVLLRIFFLEKWAQQHLDVNTADDQRPLSNSDLTG